MGTACLLAGALVLGATRPVPKKIEAEEVVAERFMVKDALGKPRSTWAVSKDGVVTLGMMAGGKPRLAIGIRKKDVGMFISDSERKVHSLPELLKPDRKRSHSPW